MEILRGILERLIYISVMSSMMFFVIFMIRLLLIKRINAKFVYFLWVLFLIRLVFPFEIPFYTSVENYVPGIFEEYRASNEVIDANNINEKLITYGSLEKEIYEQPSLSIKVMNFLVYLWLFGIFSIMFFPMISYRTLKKAIDEDEHIEDRRINELVSRAIKVANVNRLTIRYSYYLDTPALIGVIYPMIIIPHEFREYDDEVIYQILLHELIHYNAQHLILQWAFWMVKAIYWFNPVVWIAHEWMKMDAEFACDDEVIKLLGEENATSYGHNLIELAAHQGKSNYTIHASGLVNNKKELKKRIGRISSRRKKHRWLEILTLLILIMMIPMFFTIKAQEDKKNSWHLYESISADTFDGNHFSLSPTEFSYHSQTKTFLVSVDYEVDASLREELMMNPYIFDFELTFPQSYNSSIRKKNLYDSTDFSQAIQKDKPFTLSFEIEGYIIEEYGVPVLVFSGYEIGENTLEYDPMIVDISPRALPIAINVDEKLDLEIVQAGPEEDNRSYNIVYAYQMKDPIQLKSQNFTYLHLMDSFEVLDKNGNMLETQGIGGSGDEKYGQSNIKMKYIEEIKEVETIRMKISGYRFSVDGSFSWKLPITAESVVYE